MNEGKWSEWSQTDGCMTVVEVDAVDDCLAVAVAVAVDVLAAAPAAFSAFFRSTTCAPEAGGSA